MEIEPISNDVWDRLEKGERLTKDQERIIKAHIKSGNFKDVPEIVNKLRENSQHLQQKSVEQMAKVVDNLKSMIPIIFDIDQPLEKAVVYEWQASFTNAQANRLENTLIQTKDAIEEQRVREEALKNAEQAIKDAENKQRIAQEQAKAEEQARQQKALEAAKAEQERQKRAEAESQARARAMQLRAQEEARAKEMQRRMNQNTPPRDRPGQGAVDGARTATTPQRTGSIHDYLNRR